MELKQRVDLFSAWGDSIRNLSEKEKEYLYFRASGYNNWFTQNNIQLSIEGILKYLQKENLQKWISSYEMPPSKPKNIGLVMAGNIPLAGFHDFLTLLITGNNVRAKLSSQDPFLLPYFTDILWELEPRLKENISFVDRLKDFDAIIATGSDNSARYFNYYFSKYPHIIRQNRTSCAILTGEESVEELRELGKDVFQYFGLGCRNVSKLYVPSDFNFSTLFEAFKEFEYVKDHHKYNNNYDYNKSIYLVNGTAHLDSGFLLLTQSEKLVSPISVVFFDYYRSQEDLKNKLEENSNKLQCIVSKDAMWPGSVKPGTAQKPELWDYADNIDTIKWLISL